MEFDDEAETTVAWDEPQTSGPSASCVFPRIQAAQRSPDPLRVVAGYPRIVDGARELLRRGCASEAAEYLVRVLDIQPHAIDVQLLLIDSTPSLSPHSRIVLLQGIFDTYLDAFPRTHDLLAQPGAPHCWAMLETVSRLAVIKERSGRLSEGYGLRRWALWRNAGDQWNHRWPVAGFALMTGDDRELRKLDRTYGRDRDSESSSAPFWRFVDLLRAVFARARRFDAQWNSVREFRVALDALVAAERPHLPNARDDDSASLQLRWAHYFWPAVSVHVHARSWLRTAMRSGNA